jgi:transposase-like protein
MALAAIRGEQTLVELSQQFDVHINQIKQWKDQLLDGATDVFGDEVKAEPAAPAVDIKTLHVEDALGQCEGPPCEPPFDESAGGQFPGFANQ